MVLKIVFENPKTGKMTGSLVPVDFAKNAESYGCKAYKVFNEEQLVQAIEDSKKQNVPTLIDIKVLPKTMTHGYEAWWRVGTAQVADKKEVVDSAEQINEMVRKHIRRY